MSLRLLYLVTVMGLSEVSCNLIVNTLSGPVQGRIIDDLNVTFYAYLGIPYAEPPTEALRFVPPVARRPWTEVLDATDFGPACPQAEGVIKRDKMSEDCLSLNVYVPNVESAEQLPVLVYPHPGEFKSLSGDDYIYGPQFFMKRDVIFVAINYRLGALGFLSGQTEAAPGNAGLKDVLLALKWVKDNIAKFGGDPNNITLGGDSAAAIIVHYLLLSKQSTGLFNRASLISGSALGYRFLNRHPVETTQQLGKRMGYETEDINEIIENLKLADAFDIVAAQGDNNDPRNGYRPHAPFVPVVERESVHAIITQEPLEIIRNGIPQKVPIIAGINAQEGIKMIPIIENNFTLAENLNENFELCIPSNIEYPYGSQESKALAQSIKKFYFNNQVISNSTLTNFVNLVTDTQFSFGVDSWISIYKGQACSNILHYYVFDFDGELNWFKLTYDVHFKGSAHSDQASYMFATRVSKPKLETASERSKRTINVMMDLWTNFVKYGDPTPFPTSGVVNTTWSDCGAERKYLSLNDEPYMVHGPPLQERMNYWYEVYDEYEHYVRNGGTLEAKIIP